jgi:hypothetical protein
VIDLVCARTALTAAKPCRRTARAVNGSKGIHVMLEKVI